MWTSYLSYSTAPTHDSTARAAHALLYSWELRESGIDVKLIFDGGSTMRLEELVRAENPLNGLYESVKKAGAISRVCRYCFGASGGNEDGVREQRLPVD